MSEMGHFRPWRRIGVDGSLSPHSFRPAQEAVTAALGPVSRAPSVLLIDPGRRGDKR